MILKNIGKGKKGGKNPPQTVAQLGKKKQT